MLQQFTWQNFLIAAMLLSLLWYAGIILIFYRQELLGFLNGKGVERSDEPLPHRWEKDVAVLEQEDEAGQELMGKSKLPEGMSIVGNDGFSFVANEGAKAQQVGLIPDVLEELKEVFVILAKEDGNKKDFFSLMQVIKENYPGISSNPNITKLNGFIADHAPFHLSKEELDDLWD